MTGQKSNENSNQHSEPPFSRHRRYYMVLKLLVLAAAVALAARWIGLW